jgi:FlaA1/EpsC-like NDP-sugar epimerase
MKEAQIQRIVKKITKRNYNLFQKDKEKNLIELKRRIEGKSALIIGGAGSIGSHFIKQLVTFKIKKLYIIDTNENGLAEIVRELRSIEECSKLIIKSYPLNYANPIFIKIIEQKGPFEIVANFSAHKHVRSEKDRYSIQSMFENNYLNLNKLLISLKKFKPEYFFCVSTDKAKNPVNVMGATKKLMEDLLFSYKNDFNISTARFANVAFSNGSLLESFINRYEKNQPIACPADIKRYFVSMEEAGTLCLLACFLASSGDIFIPKLSPNRDLIYFKNTITHFFDDLSIKIDICKNEKEARQKAKALNDNSKSYPVFLFETDTYGEKIYEEFYNDEDVVDWESFSNLGVIKNKNVPIEFDQQIVINEANDLFKKNSSKNLIVKFLSKYVQGFSHADNTKSLDDKM